MKSQSIKVSIISQHNLYRNCLIKTIKEFSNKFEILTENNNYRSVLSVRYNDLDYLLFHLQNNIKDPIDFVSILKRKYQNTNLVILTFWDDYHFNNLLLKAGAYSYHVMGDPMDHLLEKMELNKTE